MVTYFNNDLTPCDEDPGMETRIYMSSQATLDLRLDDCQHELFPEELDNGNEQMWRHLPVECEEDSDWCGARNLGENGLNWASEPSMENIHLGYKYKNMIYFM